MTVVIDCNVLVMCLTSRSPWHTENNHFNILKTISFPKISTISIDEFAPMLNQ